MSDVLVIGGGFAGLAAARALAADGRRVTVLEKRPVLGGRAYSYTDPTTGETIDNGQHAMMGCYHRHVPLPRPHRCDRQARDPAGSAGRDARSRARARA